MFYGWWVAIAGLIQNYYSSGTFYYGFGAFFNPIIEEFGWSRAATSVAFSIQQSETGALAPFVGLFIDRFGPRRVMLAGSLLTGFGFLLLSRTSSLLTFYGAMAVLALGLSLGSYIVIVTTVSNWFIRLQGRAMAILTTGAGLAGTVVPILVLIINAYSWRTALVCVGVGTWVVGIPVALILRRRPEDYGYLPDGGPAHETATPGRDSRPGHPRRLALSRPARSVVDFSVREALRTSSFWLLAVALTTGFFAMSGVNVHLIPAQISYGFTRETAALTVTLLTLLSLAGRWLGGLLADFVDERYILATGYALQAIGILVLSVVTVYWHLIVFLLLYAPGFGATIPVRTVVQARYFGSKAFGALMGILATISTGFSILSPIFTGWMYDVHQDYRLAFIILAITCFVAVPLILVSRRPTPRAAVSV